MCSPAAPAYNGGMTRTASPTTPEFAAAGLFLQNLATGDFNLLAGALEPDAKLSALLPRGLVEWEGQGAVCDAFTGFFGGMDEYEVIDATVGMVGDRLQLRWRLHVRGGRLGPEDFVVEQHCYADSGPTGRIQFMALVCSGFRKDPFDA
jgi:hypothetical protein